MLPTEVLPNAARPWHSPPHLHTCQSQTLPVRAARSRQPGLRRPLHRYVRR